MKTELTKEVEQALVLATKADGVGVYGALEVTLGEGYGTERVDYMTMDCKNVFRCYEIKLQETISILVPSCLLSVILIILY